MRFGMDAKLIVMYSEKSLEDKQYWIEKALELGKITLDSHEYQFLSNAIKKKSYQEKIYKNEIQIDMTEEPYSEFSVNITEKNNMTVVSIYFYFY